MKRFSLLAGLGVACLAHLASPVLADLPHVLTLQGVLRDGSGDPVADSSYNVTFSIYDVAAGSSPLWTESQVVSTTDGLFTVYLGSVSPVPDSIFFDTSRYLGITVPPDPEMTPRQRLSSTGYSFVSSQWTSAGPNLYRVNGTVGIGVATPTVRLHAGSEGSEGTPTYIAGTQIAAQATNPDNWAHMAIISGSLGRSRLNFGDGFNDDQGIVSYDNALDAMSFSTAATERMRITSTGSVGIGISTPAVQLQVHDPNNITNGSRIQLTQAASGSSLIDGTALISTSPRSYLWNYENGPLILGTNSVERVRLDSVGNVGIGLTNPTVRVHTGSVGSEGTPVFIAGTHVAAQATNPDNWTHMAIIAGSAGRARLNFGDGFNDDQGIVSYDNSLDAMSFATANSEKVRITSVGSVGVGTSSPQGALDVVSTTGAFIVPRMTTAERDALTPVNGMIVYNTSTNQFNFREAGAWVTK